MFIICYDSSKCFVLFKCKFKYVFISSSVSSFYKPIFNNEFNLWVLNILYGHTFCGWIPEGAT